MTPQFQEAQKRIKGIMNEVVEGFAEANMGPIQELYKLERFLVEEALNFSEEERKILSFQMEHMERFLSALGQYIQLEALAETESERRRILKNKGR